MNRRRRLRRAAGVVLGACGVCSVAMLAGCSGGRMLRDVPTIPQAPRIAVQPRDQAVPVGRTAAFSVTAVGEEPLIYEWRRNNRALHAPSSATYVTPALSVEDSGATYSVVVSNELGSAVSLAATLTVTAPEPHAYARKDHGQTQPASVGDW